MFRIKITMFVLITILLFFTSLNAEVLNFDDLSYNSDWGVGSVPHNYKGFTWSTGTPYNGGWSVVSNDYYKYYFNNNVNFPSNPNAIFNNDPIEFGPPIMNIYRKRPFNFQGASFSSWTNSANQGATQLTIEGKCNGNVIGTSTINLSPGPLSWNSINFFGVDTLTFTATPSATAQLKQNFWLMDNFTYTTPKTYGLFIGLTYDETHKGATAAQNVYNAFLSSVKGAEVSTPIVRDLSKGQALNKDEIESALKEIGFKMKSGDSLFLYICSHGGVYTTSFDQFPGTETTVNQADEFLRLGPRDENDKLPIQYKLTDNDLYLMLQNNLGNGINKMVVLDACCSGGFWGNNNPNDVGDLEKLQNTGLLAAAKENKEMASDINGMPLFGIALAQALEHFKDKPFNIDDLGKWIEEWPDLATYTDEIVYKMDELGQPIIFSPEMWDPVLFKTDGFVGDISTVPVPSTVLLLGSGLLGLVGWRRFRKS